MPVLWPYRLLAEAPAAAPTDPAAAGPVDPAGGDDQPGRGAAVRLVVASFAASHHYRALARLLLACAADLRRSSGLPKSAFRVAVNSDLPEKKLAVLGGLGFIGRSSLLVSRQFGPACLIGLLVLPAGLLAPDLPLPALPLSGSYAQPPDSRDDFQAAAERWRDAPVAGLPSGLPRGLVPGLGCADCRACQAACPTGALSDHGYDRLRCLQHWSGRDACPEEIAARRGPRLYGCDECIAACPYSAGRSPEAEAAAETAEARLLPAERRPGRLIDAAWLAGASPLELKAFFRGTALGFGWLPASWLQDQAWRCLKAGPVRPGARGRHPAGRR